MPVATIAHDSWAEVYDLAYQRPFGSAYQMLTDRTVRYISDRVARNASIIDFGAGTGRLCLPLASLGYLMTAVDASQAMLAQLQRKDSGRIRCITSHVQDYQGDRLFDAALCVFSVFSYLTTEDSLLAALKAMYASLKPGGMLLLDIPQRAVFADLHYEDHELMRHFTVTQVAADLYDFHQEIIVHSEGGRRRYDDHFSIRYWSPETIRDLLTVTGFGLMEDASLHFQGTGAHYWLVQRDTQT